MGSEKKPRRFNMSLTGALNMEAEQSIFLPEPT